MKKMLLSACVLLTSITPSWAVQHNISMTAQVGGVCSLGTPNSLNNFTSGGAAFSVATSGGKATAKTASLRLPYTCNSTGVSFNLSSDRQGITKTISSVPGGQTNKIHYTARTITSSGLVMSNIDTVTSGVGTTGIHTEPVGEIILEVAVLSQPSGSTTLVPGNDYSDVLHLDVNPNP